MKRILLLAFLILIPTLVHAQQGVTLIQSSVEPLPNCAPSVQGKLQPIIWDITTSELNACTATNTWTPIMGGAGTPPTIQTNGTDTSTQTLVDLINSSADTVGLTVTFSNPSGGQIQAEITGGSYGGNAATASALAGSPSQCSGATPVSDGIAANGNANCLLAAITASAPLAIDSAGNITCAGCSGGSLLLQTNGVTNGSQVKLNIVAGMNMTATDDGMGNITLDSGGGGGGGGVTSVAQTVPSWLTVSGSPITTAGTLAITATGAQTSHQVIGTCNAATSFAPCVLVPGDIPTLNQNTTGSAAKWTTARLLAGNSVDGSVNATFANNFIVQGTTDTGLTGAQFLGALATGIVKNTTTTGVLSIAIAADFPTLNQNTSGTAANLSGTPALPNGTTATTQTVGDNTTKLATDAFVLANTSGATPAFSVLTSGTNTGMAGLCGTGCSLAPTGSGTITPSQINLAATGAGGVGGLLANANLAHPATTVNGQTCTLGSTCTAITLQTNGTPNTSQVLANFVSSTVNAAGLVVTSSNPSGGIEKFEITGTLAGAAFPTLTGDTTTVGGSLVTTTARVNGNSFPTGVLNNQVAVGTATSTFTYKTVPDCHTGPVALNFTQSSNAFSCNTILPLATLGDTVYGGASGVATDLAGPTGVNGVPQTYTEIPSGGAATAPVWLPGGITGRVVSSGTDIVQATDGNHWIWITTAGSVAETLAQAGTTGYDHGYAVRIVNAGSGTTTVTTTTSTLFRNDGSSGSTLAIATHTDCTISTLDNADWYAACH